MESNPIIHLAPLQGFTDFIYRKSYHKVFGNIGEYYIPYISLGKGKKIRNSQYRDILPKNNLNVPVVPQILCSNAEELKQLATEIMNFGYKKINLNLGCPYPMATNRGRGTALLENAEALTQVLNTLFDEFEFQVSVKFRSGLSDDQTIIKRIDLLNHYPIDKLIYHPRTAKQLYKGEVNRKLFPDLLKMTEKPLVYNGDIQSNEDLEEIRNWVPNQNEWMIGRGILMNPLLPDLLKGKFIDEAKRIEKLQQFHQLIYETYRQTFSDDGHVLIKLKEFWFYFSHNFQGQPRTLKVIKKTNKLSNYGANVQGIFESI